MKKLWSFVLAAALVGCGSDDSGAPPASDATASDTNAVDTAVPVDTAVAPMDTLDDATDTTPAPDTATSDTATDTTTADTATADTSTPTDSGATKRGQCYLNSHCPSGDCRANAPGGICGCTSSSGCSSSSFSCGSFAACVLDCATDADCITGMRCTTSGCALRTCTNDASCPATTVCRVLGTGSSKYCQRKLCPDGTGCPTGTTCRDSAEGKSCVEDYLTF